MKKLLLLAAILVSANAKSEEITLGKLIDALEVEGVDLFPKGYISAVNDHLKVYGLKGLCIGLNNPQYLDNPQYLSAHAVGVKLAERLEEKPNLRDLPASAAVGQIFIIQSGYFGVREVDERQSCTIRE